MNEDDEIGIRADEADRSSLWGQVRTHDKMIKIAQRDVRALYWLIIIGFALIALRHYFEDHPRKVARTEPEASDDG